MTQFANERNSNSKGAGLDIYQCSDFAEPGGKHLFMFVAAVFFAVGRRD